MLTKEEIKRILYKIKQNQATQEEIAQFNLWYESFDDSITYLDIDVDLERLSDSIWAKIQMETAPKSHIRIIYRNPYLRIAASLLVIGLISFWVYRSQYPMNPNYAGAVLIEGVAMKDVVIHSTESDFLDSTKFLNIAAIKSDAQVSKISTGQGQFIKVKLPDGTKVSLSSGSQITLSDDFQTAQHRTVYLNGEAYFEVSKITGTTFNVIAKDQKIQVLGTKFNVKAYENQKEIITSLLEGSIKLDNGKESRMLVPNDVAITNSNTIEIKKEVVAPSIGWRSLNFEFENETVEDVLSQLSHWYGLKVVFNSKVPNLRISGKIPRGTSVGDLQLILQNLTNGEFELKNKELHIKFNNN